MAHTLTGGEALEKSRDKAGIETTLLKFRVLEYQLLKRQIRMNTGETRGLDCVL
jgi:hypothetical protein